MGARAFAKAENWTALRTDRMMCPMAAGTRGSTVLTAAQARRFLLIHQGLWPPRQLSGSAGVMKYLRRVRSIQFDPLDIVGHNHELVLQSRVGDFSPAVLESLLYKSRKLLDGWDKQMSIYPVEDRPYFSRQRVLGRIGPVDPPEIRRTAAEVRKALKARGPLSSIDLEHDGKVDWPWGPTRLARAALESMYFRGELVIHHRVHTRKVYDFARNYVPGEILDTEDPNRTEKDYQDWHVHRRLRGIGLAWARSSEAWLEIHGVKSRERAEALDRLMKKGLARRKDVEGIDVPLYMAEEDRATLSRACRDSDVGPLRACIIAPLDNLLWDRGLVRSLFGFDYVWEVYKRPHERKYGYYVLPVLYGDRFVARFEPGKDRDIGALEIRGWWWEPGVAPSRAMKAALIECFHSFVRYLGAPEVRVSAKARETAGVSWLEAR
jgi:uncharacterized protein YcaQ